MKPPKVEFSRYTLAELKEAGHDLLNQYAAMDDKRTGKEAISHAYEKLGSKLGTMYGKHHFSQMYNRKEIVMAISRLRKMILQRKKKIDFITESRRATKFLPQAEMRKALIGLKNHVR